MVLEFDGFIETARMASYDLQKFNSHVGRGVDIVLSTARWTQRLLDDMAHKQSSRGVIPGFIQDKILAPFKPVQFTEAMLLDQYIAHTRVVSEEIERLIEEAQALLLVLQNLEDRLDVIHAVAMHDNIAAQAEKDEILSHLWTLLGGNRAKLGKFNNQLGLLRQVGQYRKVAWAHVSATILKLQAMGAELEELRSRVSSAEVLKGHREIPLAVHVENIRLGVERLEEGRDRARKLEQGHVRRVLDGAQQGDLLVSDGT
jgi:regulator of replication initiation timing